MDREPTVYTPDPTGHDRPQVSAFQPEVLPSDVEPEPYRPLSGKLPPGVHLTGIDPRRIKLRELAEVEEAVGRKLAGEMESGQLGMDTMAGLLWVVVRRQYPGFSFADAGEFDMGTLTDLFEDDDDQPPPLPPGTPDPTRATQSGGDTSVSLRGDEP